MDSATSKTTVNECRCSVLNYGSWDRGCPRFWRTARPPHSVIGFISLHASADTPRSSSRALASPSGPTKPLQDLIPIAHDDAASFRVLQVNGQILPGTRSRRENDALDTLFDSS